MNNKKIIICIIVFVIFVLLIKKLLKNNICENYEEIGVLTKTNDGIIKYIIDIDDKMNKLMNDINDKLIQAKSDNDKIINTIGLTWIEYKPDNYIKALKDLGYGEVTISNSNPKINNLYNTLSYLYMIQGKNLRIKFNYSTNNTTGNQDGDGYYYVQLPIINSIQLIADKSLLKFSSDFKTEPYRYGFEYLCSTCRGVGIYQNSDYMYLMNCFLYDNQKIMFEILNRNDNLGLVNSRWGKLSSLYLLYFEIDIPIV